MTDSDLENIYKAGLAVSHYAGLRAVFDAGYDIATSVSLATSAGDPSATASAPSLDVQATTITTP